MPLSRLPSASIGPWTVMFTFLIVPPICMAAFGGWMLELIFTDGLRWLKDVLSNRDPVVTVKVNPSSTKLPLELLEKTPFLLTQSINFTLLERNVSNPGARCVLSILQRVNVHPSLSDAPNHQSW